MKEKLVKDSGVAEEGAYDNIVQKLLTKPRARGKVLNTCQGTPPAVHEFYFFCFLLDSEKLPLLRLRLNILLCWWHFLLAFNVIDLRIEKIT